MPQKIKGKRILKNGAIAGYVYCPKDKKWKWRIIKGPLKGGRKKKKFKEYNEYNTIQPNHNSVKFDSISI
jgi:hypothetical protein